MVDGKPVCANGVAGNDGIDAIAPQVRINPETKMWEISIDGGETWTDTGVRAEGSVSESGDKIFESIDISNPDFVIFVLSNGTEFKVAKFNTDSPMFLIVDCEGVQQFVFGEQQTFDVDTANVADFSGSKPDGWAVKFTEKKIVVTACKQ